jgi:hypothetical protein
MRNLPQTHFILQSPRAPSRLPRYTSYIAIIAGVDILQRGLQLSRPRLVFAAWRVFAGLTFEMHTSLYYVTIAPNMRIGSSLCVFADPN